MVRDALAALPYEFVARLARGRHREAARRRGLRRAARRRPRGGDRASSSRRSWSTSPTSRCSARASASASRAACSRSGCRTSAPTFASTRRELAPFALPSLVDRRHRASASARRPSPATSRGCSRATATWSSWRWAAAGRPSRSWPRCSRRSSACSSSRARAGTRPPTTSRRPRSRASSTIGCRRCGGGLAGAPGESNVLAGAALAAEREPGPRRSSTAAARRSRRSRPARACSSTSAAQPAEVVTGYLNAFRILVSDLVVVDRRGRARTSELARRDRTRSRTLPVVLGRAAAAAGRAGRSAAGRVLHDGARRRARGDRAATCATSTAPRSCSSPATSPAATRCARSSARVRRRRLPRRDQGRRDRRRRRGGARARGGGRVRGQRARPGRRADLDTELVRARRRRRCAREAVAA